MEEWPISNPGGGVSSAFSVRKAHRLYAATPTAILGRSLDKSCHLTEAELFPICRERRFCADDIIHEFDGNHG